MSYFIRSIETSDEPLLWEFLYQALYAAPKTSLLPREIVHQPELAKYVQAWGLRGDGKLCSNRETLYICTQCCFD